MRFATLKTPAGQKPVVVSNDASRYWDLQQVLPGFNGDLVDAIAQLSASEALAQLPEDQSQALDAAQLTAPIPNPRRNVFCVGKNYHAHAQEFSKSGFDSSAKEGEDAPPFPVVFTKAPSTVVGPRDAVESHSAVTSQLDYEAELAVVIGKGGRGISKADALKHVFGYTVVNDVTARDLQKKHRQWFLGKSLDTFCPMGPWIVSADEVDVANLQVRCWINGELRQDANTADLIFDVPTLIETISAGIELQPGDVIATGTPVGVGIGFTPPKFLQPGDVMRIEIEGIGTIENTVR